MAGSGNRDVQLTISAKNEATKAIDSVAAALQTLAGIQTDVGQSAQKTDGLLGELTAQLAQLSAQAKGLEALGVAAGAIDKASGAVERLQNQVERSKGENQGLAESYAQAAESTRALSEAAAQAKGNLEAQRAALVAIRAADKTNTAAIAEQKALVTAAALAFKELQAQVRASAANENQLDTALSRSTVALEKQQGALGQAAVGLAEIKALAEGASIALGGVAASQEAVAIASTNTAQDIARVNAALASQHPSTGGASTQTGPAAAAVEAYRAQVQAVNEARTALRAASAEATRLGAALAGDAAPTQQLTREFVLAKTAAANAKTEFEAQARALGVLRGQTSGTFATFSAAARQAAELDRAMRGGAAATAILARVFPVLVESEEAATVKARTLGDTLRSLVGVLTTIPTAAGEAEEGINRVGNAGHGSLDIFTRMRNELLALTTAYVGFYGAINAVGDVVKTLQVVQGAQQRLAVAFDGDNTKVAAELGFVREQAERLGISFNTLATEYTRIAIAGKEAGYSAEGTRKIFLAFAEAGRVAGLSQQQLESAFLGLRESIERGTINARNFNLEIGQNVPGAVQAMAQAVGVSTAKFTALQKASSGVAANEDTLVKFADILREKFSGQLPAAVQTLNAEMGRFQAHLQEAQLAVAKGGFAEGLTTALKNLDGEFKDGSGDKFFRNLGAVMGSLAGVIPLVVNNFGLLVDALKIFVGLKVAESILAVATSGKLFGISFAGAAVNVDRLIVATARLFGEQGLLAAAFTRVRVAAAATIATLEGMSLAEALLAVRSGLAAAGSTILSAALTGLRGVMIAAAATAEAMWLAIGGFPGLIITGLTFIVTGLLGDWVSGIGSANDAMDAHLAIMDKVRQAYADAAGDAEKFKNNLKDITALEVDRDRSKQHDKLDAARKSAGEFTYAYNGPGSVDADGVIGDKAAAQLTELIAKFKAGTISATEFRTKLSDFGEAHPAFQRVSDDLIAAAKNASEAEKAIAEADATLRVIRGTASEADYALAGLPKTMAAVNAAFDPSALDRYNKALLDLQKQIPGLAKLAELKDKLAKVQDDFASGELDLQGPLKSKDPKVKAQAEAALAVLTRARDQGIAQINAVAALDAAQEGSGQKFLDTARKFIGDSAANHPDALNKLIGKRNFADEAWCADFLNAVLKKNDTPGTGSAAAKSFLNFGTAVTNQDARPGDVVVIRNKNGTFHVGLYAGPAADGRLNVLGGNQHGGQVNEESFAASSVAAIRRAPGLAEQQKLADKNESAQEEFDRSVVQSVAALHAEAEAIKLSARDAFIQSKVNEQQKRVDDSGPTASDPTRKKLTFTAAQRAGVTTAAGDEFDAKQQLEEEKKVAATRLELNTLLKGDAATLTRAEFIHNEAIKDGVNLLDAEGQKYGALKGQIYDLTQAHKAYNDVVSKGTEYKNLGRELVSAFKDGDVARIAEVKKQMAQLRAEITAALPAAQAFADAMGDQKMVTALQKVGAALKDVKADLFDAQQVNKSLADGLTGAFDKSADAVAKFAQGIGSARDLLRGVRNAFLQFASDFLRQIADMILKQIILNALSKSPIGGFIAKEANTLAGVQSATALTTAGATVATTIATSFTAAGATVAAQIAAAMATGGVTGGAGKAGGGILGGILGLFGGGAGAGATVATADLPALLLHGGGVVGAPGGMSRRVSPQMFVDAARYHGGGIPGLNPGEVPTILKKNEEVLTESDARHAFNGGKSGSASPTQTIGVKIVNAFDHGDMLSQAMKTEVGEKAVLNHVRNNQGKWNQAMGRVK